MDIGSVVTSVTDSRTRSGGRSGEVAEVGTAVPVDGRRGAPYGYARPRPRRRAGARGLIRRPQATRDPGGAPPAGSMQMD